MAEILLDLFGLDLTWLGLLSLDLTCTPSFNNSMQFYAILDNVIQIFQVKIFWANLGNFTRFYAISENFILF